MQFPSIISQVQCTHMLEQFSIREGHKQSLRIFLGWGGVGRGWWGQGRARQADHTCWSLAQSKKI